MSDPATPELPSWLNGLPAAADGDGWRLQRHEKSVALGDVPAGARLYIENAVRVTVTAEKVDPSAVLDVQIVAIRAVIALDADFRHLVVHGGQATIETSHACDVDVDGGRHRLVIDPVDGAASNVVCSGGRPELRILNNDGLAEIHSTGDVQVHKPLTRPVVVDVAGTLSVPSPNKSPVDLMITGHANGIVGPMNLRAGSVITCDHCHVTGDVTGAQVTATASVYAANFVDAVVTINGGEGLVVRAGTADPNPTLVIGDDKMPGGRPSVGTGGLHNTTVDVSSAGDVMAGDVLNGSIVTGGSVAARSINDATRVRAAGSVWVEGPLVGVADVRTVVEASTVDANQVANLTVTASERVTVWGRCDEATVDSPTVRISGETARSKITCDELIAQELVSSSTLTCTSANLPTLADTDLTIGTGEVHQSDTPVLWTQTGPLKFAVAGQVQVTRSPPVGADNPVLTLPNGTGTVTVGEEVAVYLAGADCTVELTTGKSSKVNVADRLNITATSLGAHSVLTLGDGTHLELPKDPGDLQIVVPNNSTFAGDLTNLLLFGDGHLHIKRGTVGTALVQGTDLSVDLDGRIKQLKGAFALSSIAGHIDGDSTHPPFLMRFTGQVGDDTSKVSDPRGSLRGIDITHLPFSDLRQLSGLRVFDPSSARLIHDAKAHGGNRAYKKWRAFRAPNVTDDQQPLVVPPAREPDSVVDRAKWFDQLAQQTEKHTLTGSAASAVEWGRHYLHHRRSGFRSASQLVDRGIRYLHQGVGYGYRPGPAVVFLAVVTFAVSLWSLPAGCDASVTKHNGGEVSEALIGQFCVGDDREDGAWDLGRAWASVAFAPAKLIRITDATSALPYFSPPLDTVANAVIGLTFLFMVLAFRNYFRINPLA